MALTTIEVFALITAVAAAIKLLFILFNPGSWAKLTKAVWKTPLLTGFLALILAAVVLYYILQEMTIVQIFAVMLFVALLAAVSMAFYAKEMTGIAGKLLKKGVLKKAWFPILIWLILIIWVLYVLFA